MLRHILCTGVALLVGAIPALACTSVIVSGRVTPDGRPYIFKNRDTGNTDNLVAFVLGERYRFIAVVARRDSLAEDVWSGHNEAGFAIANTAAYNLNGRPQPGLPRPNNDEHDGRLMRKALGQCATLADAGFALKKQLFPLERSNGADYINVARLINHAGTGILQQLTPIEDELFRRASAVITVLRRNGRAGRETTEFYQWVDQYVREQYQQRFGVIL